MTNSDVDPKLMAWHLERASARIVVLEKMIEDQSRDLYFEHLRLTEANGFLSTVLELMETAIFVTNEQMKLVRVNNASCKLLRVDEEKLIGNSFHELVQDRERFSLREELFKNQEFSLLRSDGSYVQVMLSKAPHPGEVSLCVFAAIDLTAHRELLAKLEQSRKLEAIGRLAAGIAHEINTPMQFIGDNLQFLAESFEQFQTLVGLSDVPNTAPQSMAVGENSSSAAQELEFLRNEIPSALAQSIDGTRRVSKIVSALKQLFHSGQESAQAINVNLLIKNALDVSANEWKYVARTECDLEPHIPLVHCSPGAFSQVILGIIMNAAQAIEEKNSRSQSGIGLIRVHTFCKDAGIAIEISDSGTGISPEHIDKIFDPFFTTKEFGKGSGQGLAVARAVVVEQLKGTIEVKSQLNTGTAFTIWLPKAESTFHHLSSPDPQHDCPNMIVST